MPISLENSSNIRVTYNTGSNYIIETVKSDLYVRGTTSGNLSSEPTVSPNIRSDVVIETYTYTGTANTKDYTKEFTENTQCDILIVGGGGGGGSGGGGGGGGGGVVYKTSYTINSGTYTISVGKGGSGGPGGVYTTPGSNGFNSSFGNLLTAIGGGGGGADGVNLAEVTGRNGGSGGGGSAEAAVGPPGSGTQPASTSGGYGNSGGNSSSIDPQYGSGGGGGAGGVGGNGSGSNGGVGGIGIPITISGSSIYYAGGGGGGTDAGAVASGGLGGGGSTNQNGTDNTGGGGGGKSNKFSQNASGNGGSGIVIVKYKYTSDQRYRLHFPRKTKVQFILNGDGNLIPLNNDLLGTYIITMTSTNSTIEKEGEPANKQEMPSNKLEIIYELFDTLDNINSTFTDSLTTTKSKQINVYNNTLSSINNCFLFQPNKYNKYKISGFIPKANKKGDNDIDFNIVLIIRDPKDSTRLIDMSKDLYSIRYVFQSFVSANEITPIDIYITIKPLPDVNKDTIYYSYFALKTYFRSSGSGLNSSEIQVFLSNRSKSTSITSFNNIGDWITDLSNKNIWGLSTMDEDISKIIINLLSVDNIDNKCNTTNDLRICDIRKLIYIKNKINGTSVSSTGSPSLIQNVSIVSQNVFPRNSLYVNFNIDDYISYESSTLIAPQQRTTTFDIKSTATKYMYFYMGQVS